MANQHAVTDEPELFVSFPADKSPLISGTYPAVSTTVGNPFKRRSHQNDRGGVGRAQIADVAGVLA